MSDSSTLISLTVRDFAVPVPRQGSIESNSGFGRAALEGQLIHLKVQNDHVAAEPRYRPEVPVKYEWERSGFRFAVGGRIDGLFEYEPPRTPLIEEIKSAFQLDELARKLTRGVNTHPYCLQLKTYGYLYRLQSGVIPTLRFCLVSTRNHGTKELEIDFDIGEYENWLERRLAELVGEAERWQARSLRRHKTARSFPFPFPKPRPGQTELVETIGQALHARRRALIQAPTGLGKTIGVLYPALQEALSRGQNVIYVTPKNSQHSVAEDAVTRFQETGAKVRSLTITAKQKICFKAEPLCNPDYCEYARDHYTKVHANGLLEVMAKKRKLTRRTFQKLGEQYQVCPFELQMEAAREAETVICDYNYVFSPRSAFGRLGGVGIGQEGKPNLVIDEAHNLYARGMDYFSPALSSQTLERMREAIRKLPWQFAGEAERLLDEGLETLRQCQPETEGEEPSTEPPRSSRILPPFELFLDHDANLRAFLSRYLESDVEISPGDIVLRLCFYWAEFTAALDYVRDPDRAEFFTTYHPHASGGTIRITCCDASKMLQGAYDEFENVVGFSATLKPFSYYAKLSGLNAPDLLTAEFRSPFPHQHRKLLVIPQISTKYASRSRNYPKVAEAIQRIAALRAGNYFAFFPSFEFLERVFSLLVPPPGFTVLRQYREMPATAIEGILDHLRREVQPTIVFAVQGGVFSEGVDYPGRMIIGAFVVGPPLPSFDLEREAMREYYQRYYGSGFEYAYAFPAMAKAVQAAGRVIRSETDRGLIVLMDNRFLEKNYSGSMPEGWFEEGPRELVSASILKEVQEFWEEK